MPQTFGRQALGTVLLLLAPILLASCSDATESDEPDDARPGTTTTGLGEVRVEARRDVMVTDTPLGDVVSGTLEHGDEGTASCFVRRAQTNAGFFGSAVKISVGDVSGYAAVTDFPADHAGRTANFDLDEDALRDRLPTCAA
jgi:hypothetical protein